MPLGSPQTNVPDWNTNLIVGGVPSLTDNCNKCHEAPPLSITAHDGSETLSGATGCFNCHDHFNDGGTLNNPALHIDGTLQAQGFCNSCHEYPPYPGDSKAYQAVEGKGAHIVHVEYLSQLLYAQPYTTSLDPANDTFGAGVPGAICGTCHTNTVGNHRVAPRLINFGDNGNLQTVNGVLLQFGPTGALPTQDVTYNGIVGTLGSVQNKTCSNLSCHFNTTPQWEPY
jgi:hypothetical protein